MPDHPRLHLHGAARGVTGSCFRLETPGGALLVDCGMFQGSKTEKALNYRDFPFDPAGIAAVVLTHAHIDHSGLLPKLVKTGFRGRIHATPATVDLAGIMLPDSAHIQEVEVGQLNRRRARWHDDPLDPIYDTDDVARTLSLMAPEPYGDWFAPLPGVRARFWNAGHMLGSASVEVEVARPGSDPLRLLFSGDLGPAQKLLHPPPEGPVGLDFLILEATYGGTDRPVTNDDARRALLGAEVRAAMAAAERHGEGALVIPSFAVERAQEVITDLMHLMAEGALPGVPVHVDSPLATRATEVYHRHARTLDGGRAFRDGLASARLHFTQTVEQSIALDRLPGFHIVIAASGMCEAGRIRHRLRRWLGSPGATVLMVGYQAQGTLGRILLDGAPSVRIQGDGYAVRARIRSLDLYSGHADAPELAQWVAARAPVRAGIILTHAEPPAMDALAA
jgi:metallo-beta-lactamase family protein